MRSVLLDSSSDFVISSFLSKYSFSFCFHVHRPTINPTIEKEIKSIQYELKSGLLGNSPSNVVFDKLDSLYNLYKIAAGTPHLSTPCSRIKRIFPLALTFFHLFNCFRLIGFPLLHSNHHQVFSLLFYPSGALLGPPGILFTSRNPYG